SGDDTSFATRPQRGDISFYSLRCITHETRPACDWQEVSCHRSEARACGQGRPPAGICCRFRPLRAIEPAHRLPRPTARAAASAVMGAKESKLKPEIPAGGFASGPKSCDRRV